MNATSNFNNTYRLLETIFHLVYLTVMGNGAEPKLSQAYSWNEQSRSTVEVRENKGQERDQSG